MAPNGASSPTERLPALQRLHQWLLRSSIRRKIVGVIFISGVVPIVLVLILARLSINHALEGGLGLFLINRATAIASEIDSHIDREIEITQEMAGDDALGEQIMADPHAASELTTILQRLEADALIDARGDVIAGTLSDLPLEEALRALSEDLPDDLTDDVHLLEHYETAADPGWAVFVAPVLGGDGAVAARLVRLVSMAALVDPVLPPETEEFFVTVVNERDFSVSGRRLGDRRDLFGPFLTERAGRLEAWGTQRGPEGELAVVASRRVRALEMMEGEGRAAGAWFVLCSFNVGHMMGELELDLWKVGLAASLAVGIFLLMGLSLARRIIGPLRLLRDEAREIAAGNLERRAQIHTNDEIEELAVNFNIMALRLESTLSDLEGKIEMLHMKTDQLETLGGITRAITESLDRSVLLTTFEREVQRLTDFDALWIGRITPSGAEIEITHSTWSTQSPPEGLRVGDTVPMSDSWMGHAVAENRALIVRDLADSPETHHEDEALRGAGARSALFLPLPRPGGALGAVGLARARVAHFGKSQAALLTQACEQLAIGLEHSRLYAELRSLAEGLEDTVRARTAALDIANRRLFQVEKFAATGKLAANVAHEINNPLAIIKNYLHLIKTSLESASGGRRGTDPNLPNVQVIKEEIERIARIVTNLLNIYRPAPEAGTRASADVNGELESILRLAEGSLEKRHIRAELDLEGHLPPVACSPDLVRQVLLNLIRNAEDAMTDGDRGTLTITTRREELDGEVIHIVVEVADTGCGISPEHRDQVFDPFFTTKEESGTGLGLSVTFGILESIGGALEFDSRVGEGTTFRALFPPAD